MFNHRRSSLHNDAAYARRMVRNIQAKDQCYKSLSSMKSETRSQRDRGIAIVRVNMHCQGIAGNACTRSFDISLTSAEGQKQECFK